MDLASDSPKLHALGGAPASQEASVGSVARKVAAALRRHVRELSHGPLVVAVSGGADSMALLIALMAIPSDRRPSLTLAHFSHGLRPKDELREAALVESIAARWALPITRGHGDVATHAREHCLSLEDAGRRLRYDFLIRIAREQNARAVALGHTLDDQAETVLLRLVRGTGLRGLGAMREWTLRHDPESTASMALLRPLLEVRRYETLAVCTEAEVIFAHDASNRSLRFSRNRVRMRVLPELERINPEVRQALVRLSLSAQADEALLDCQARAAMKGQEERHPGGFSWPRQALASLPLPLLIRLFQVSWESLRGPGSALSQVHLKAMTALLSGPSGRQINLPWSMCFSVDYYRCSLGSQPSASFLPKENVPLQIPGTIRMREWLVEISMSTPPLNELKFKDPWCAVMDADAVAGPLTVRGRRTGDRFHPLGMDGPKRLQDFLVDEKVPGRERDQVPLVVAERGVAWVVGLRLASWAAATPTSREVMTISFCRVQAPD